MGKGWRTRHKGKSRNKHQRAAAEVAQAASELDSMRAQGEKRKRAAEARASGTDPPVTHVPAAGRGGKRAKIDLETLTPRSKKRALENRRHGKAHRLRKRLHAVGGAVTDAFAADPTEAWRAKGN